ncbi:EF-hand and coiled-coil domain-containing protein 1 [Polypterus senegalus]|uniref:EF-hand and coiled-coil domain-containing protein 1 n=1 Tax=Polypterus senegalus TaxID=55291 RepID=UPI0019660A98|nr:EF-hand and coiled-coil domain-containing protein 1 [Polypterus senegalus]XP_039626847.1 EF-hand and coiled-coil domain-containing protein 1 [Polypterus senegalus]
MDNPEDCDPYCVPARRAQWIVSVLAYHYGLDRGAENEIIVLATGLDQYLQEIYHHLDFYGEGKIPSDDFKVLCEVLGLESDAEVEEGAGILEDLPCELSFRQFHSRLCGYFSTKAGCQCSNVRLPVSKESEHIETQIRVRSPLRRRKTSLSRASSPSPHLLGQCVKECAPARHVPWSCTAEFATAHRVSGSSAKDCCTSRHVKGVCAKECVSTPLMHYPCKKDSYRHQALCTSANDLDTDLPRSCTDAFSQSGPCTRGHNSGSYSPIRHGSEPCPRECYEEIVALEEAEDRIAKLEDENASLRELVEDMRAALQSSDARCLALQVGLWKSHDGHTAESGCYLANRRSFTQKSHSQMDNKCLKNLLCDMEKMPTTGNGKIEEAMKFNQDLENELKMTREALRNLEECNRSLKWEQAEMRKKIEEAREAVLSSLSKVRELEVKAQQVPTLQRHVAHLESELGYYRSTVIQAQVPMKSPPGEENVGATDLSKRECCLSTQQDRRSPTGHAETSPDGMGEQLFRSVEGQAASDEEEDKWIVEQQSQVDNVRRILSKLSCCRDRCEDKTMKKMLSYFKGTESDGHLNLVVELLDQMTMLTKQLEQQDNEMKKMEEAMNQIKSTLIQEQQQKMNESEVLQTELQMLETERVRLSLVEEKLLDVLQLLLQLRDLNISRRLLGKILLSTLGSCNDLQHGKSHVLEVLNTLQKELAGCELFSGSTLERSSSCQSLSSALLISC